MRGLGTSLTMAVTSTRLLAGGFGGSGLLRGTGAATAAALGAGGRVTGAASFVSGVLFVVVSLMAG